MTKSTPHFRSAQKMIRRSQITGGIILIIYDSRFPGEQLWVMCSALERFETLAVSALLDTHLAMKMDTSSLKDKQQSWLLLTRGVIWPVLQCWLMLDIIWTIGHYLRGVSCSATLLGFSEFWINAYQMSSWSHLSGQGCQMHFFLFQLLENIKHAIVLRRQRAVQRWEKIVGVSWQINKSSVSAWRKDKYFIKTLENWDIRRDLLNIIEIIMRHSAVK